MKQSFVPGHSKYCHCKIRESNKHNKIKCPLKSLLQFSGTSCTDRIRHLKPDISASNLSSIHSMSSHPTISLIQAYQNSQDSSDTSSSGSQLACSIYSITFLICGCNPIWSLISIARNSTFL
jgi:hypothetical protein